ncbi:uncharacterized protein ASPGLDRAFT_459678 [Aspergillus glaucus CBS 516.65]|uniref:Uncharacterized protein n=1 Tax=Aspergillus glaucus CBS 516.65 TaxID=1160497 RepID=A0A1L9VGS1_ASPGL|nr:hypothetical protein ASPGLDRAFT_459678 [Aspergillus glaucus CBS 516.65]OJJ83116.1 hypothetical protein ASPGLDRAFT_459678 [Aspergillus glaucus CBS 516.65]
MIPLTTVVAVAVSLSVLFIVCSVVGTIVWIRIRQERLSMAVANTRNGQYARGLQNFPAETVTELSPEEGTVLGQYGQLPYGSPAEWALIDSRERLVKPIDPETCSILSEKPRSLRQSPSRSRSKRWSKGGFRRPPRGSSLAPVGEKFEKRSLEKSSFETRPSVSKDEVEVSAVEGIMELPAETSPRQSPDREEPPPDPNLHSPGIWSVYMNRDYSSSLFPVREDEHEGFDPYRLRVRGTSLTTQTAGTMPDQPVPPPPPCAYPSNRFRLSRNDSSMRLSSLSLDTADSSILEDGRRTPMLIDSNFNSPALPPCPTFVPYSANDVGRLDRSFSTKSSLQGSFAFPSGSVELEAYRMERERTSPRRSLTARSPSHSMERICPPPRRSESLSSTAPRRDPRFASLGNMPILYPSPNNIPAHWNGINYNSALLPHFSQIRRSSVRQHPPRESTDSLFSSTDNLLSVSESPSRRSSNVVVHETPLSADSLPRLPPPSALKGGNGPRKGHRRQNCVRISIHPPITYGGSVFSPMAEEPEEHDGAASRRSEVSELSATNMSSLPSISTISIDRQNHHERSRPSSYRCASYRTSPPKWKHARTGSKDTGNTKNLPGIDTSLAAREASLCRTPSPDKSPPAWSASHQAPSPSTRENPPTPGEPRVSAVKGPRSQPRKPVKNTQRSSMPLAENSTSPSPSTSSNSRQNSLNQNSQKSSSTLNRGNSNSTNNTSTINDQDAAGGLEVVSGPQPTRPLSPSCGVNKTPSNRSGNIVTIWEDTKIDTHLERTPTKQSSVSAPGEVIELQGDVSFNQIERHKSTGGIKEPEGKDTHNDKPPRAASQRSTQPELMTPVNKIVGLGIGATAATPGSLYDGDGFLKE